jgi:choline/glycine/proline betaine transport protein
VFFISGVLILGFVAFGIWAGLTIPEGDLDAASWNWIANTGEYFGWLYALAATFFVIFVLGLLFSRFGKIKLGPDDSKPEFGTLAWFSMLFTAGMGIGLVFWGVAEPTGYVGSAITPQVPGTDPILDEGLVTDSEVEERADALLADGTAEDGAEAQGMAQDQLASEVPIPELVDAGLMSDADVSAVADEVMSTTLFHWSFHPWAIYIVLGLALGYFCFRKGLPLRPASAFYPLIGDRIYRWPGHIIDILAVFGTMFGLATSLGLGAQQINAGLNEVFGAEVGPTTQIIIIAIITLIALVSVVAGIDKGIRRLSVLNMWLAALLLAVVFLAGPLLFMISGMADWFGAYLQTLPENSLAVVNRSLDPDMADWQAGWTFFYWGWWISWAPFVGMFIARISYGRTIRQFVAGVLFAPVGVTLVWFGIFGGSGLYYDLTEGTAIGAAGRDFAMYAMLAELPLQEILVTAASLLTIIVVTLFFVTSSDSGSLVIDILTNGGDPNPNRVQRAFWAILEGAVAAVLILAGGAAALQTLQAASLTTGVPFAIVLVFVAFGLLKALRNEPDVRIHAEGVSVPGTPSRPEAQAADTSQIGAGGSVGGSTP